MTFMCKKCKKAFRKDMSVYEESDEYCPHCDNHYVRYSSLASPFHRLTLRRAQVLEAKTPQAAIGVEADDTRMNSRCVSWM